MANGDNSDRSVQLALIDQHNDLIRQIRSAAAEGEQLANSGNSRAFEPLKDILSEIASIQSTGHSTHVGNLQSEVEQRMTGASRLASAAVEDADFLPALESALNAISEWEPAIIDRDERPTLALEGHEDFLAKKASDAADAHDRPDRCRERESRAEILSSVEAVLASIDRSRSEIVTGNSSPRSANTISRIADERFLVVYGNETGEIRGAGAYRLVRLIREGRVGLVDLATEVDAIASSRSVSSEHQGGDLQVPLQVSVASQLSPTELRRLEQSLRDDLQDVNLRLGSTLSLEEQEQLESDRRRLVEYLNGLERIPDSDTRRLRDTVYASLRRLSGQVATMPNFTRFLSSSYDYDESRSQFVYCASIEWEFENF